MNQMAAWETAGLVLNLIAFILYGLDKRYARSGAWRISERALLIASFAGGIGAFIAMRLFHHKTRKMPFRVVVPLFALLQGTVWGIVVWNVLK